MIPREWPFADPVNVAVFVDRRLLGRETWISFVTHDADDGAWKFHGPGQSGVEATASVVGLGTVFSMDASIGALADLPFGWCAWRNAADAPWQRAPRQDPGAATPSLDERE